MLRVEEFNLELAAIGALNSDVELLLDVLRVDLKNLNFLACMVVACSLFFGRLKFH